MGSISPDRSRLETTFEKVQQQYHENHPLSKKGNDEACLYMPGGNTRTVLYQTPFPLTIASGESTYLTTVDGHRYVDFLGEYTAGIYGHNNPVIRKAVEKALDGGWNYGGHNAVEKVLAQTICERFPAIQTVRFVNSGTEANMMAIATALVYTGKKKILLFNKGYHGSTISGRVATGKPTINLPHDFVVGTYNDVEGTENLIKQLSPDSLAAILVEPMMGSGGGFRGSPEFLACLRKLADEQKALLIFDEVMTSRLSYHGLSPLTGVTPDMMTLGKWVGGGMSFGAFGGRKDIMSLYDPRSGKLEHPGTFNNNTFTMNAGVAGCALLNESTIDTLNSLGDKLRNDVEAVFKAYGIQGKVPSSPPADKVMLPNSETGYPSVFVNGMGSIVCLIFTGPNSDILQPLFWHHMLDHGIYMAQRGFMALNIELTEEHVALYVDAVKDFVNKHGEYLKS